MTSDGTGLTHADVERIVQLVEDAGFGYVHFEADGLELTLVKEGYVEAPAPGAAPAPTAAAVPAAAPTPATSAAPPEAPVASGPPAVAEAATPPPSAEVADVDDTGVIRSPMVGIFYRAPDPESPPYVSPGDVIEAGATIGLVEVMKMFTAIRADTSGTVAEVLVENAQQVDRGQPLVRIEER